MEQQAIITFADTALAIEDEVESFNHIVLRVVAVQFWRCVVREFSPAHFGSAQATH